MKLLPISLDCAVSDILCGVKGDHGLLRMSLKSAIFHLEFALNQASYPKYRA